MKTQMEACGVDSERLSASRRRLYEYQARILEARYADVRDGDDLRDLFFRVLYVPPEDEIRLVERNREFIRVSGHWMLRVIGAGYVTRVLRQVIELHELTRELDSRVASYLVGRAEWFEEGDGRDAVYREAMRAVTTKRDRMRQVECALAGYDLVALVVRQVPFDLTEIIRRTPKSWIRNKDLLDLSVTAYKTFVNHKHELEELRRLMQEREAAYIDAMFS